MKRVPGMGGAMDLVTGAKRVVVAMQHTARGAPKIVRQLSLPLTLLRPVDLLFAELTVNTVSNRQATRTATAPGVEVPAVLAATEAALAISRDLPVMPALP